MNNIDIIHKLQEQISAGHSDAYTAPLVEIARKAIAEQNSSPEQQSQLLSLVELGVCAAEVF